ncbi:hypothetical protein, partial [Saccharolobus solfataricus]|uniref:hypothetical protein n=1 Tax=Saccharolobus solfataricus TaxID=2287 RepID=UPI0001C39565
MKWSLLFLIVIVTLPILSISPLALLIGGGGPNNSGAGVYTQSVTVNIGLGSQSKNGNTLYSAGWTNPSYLSNTSSGGLIILQDTEYIYNNVSFLPSGAQGVAINVTFITPAVSSPGGAFAIGYGTYITNTLQSSYSVSNPPKSGLIVILEHGAMASYHIFVVYNGAILDNISLGFPSLSSSVTYGLGFNYTATLVGSTPEYIVTVYFYNGTLHTYTITTPNALTTLNTNYQMGAFNAGPAFGYSEYEIVSYRYYINAQTTLTVSYYALAYNIYHFLIAYAGAGNPVNITPATGVSVTVNGITAQTNYTITGIQQSLADSVTALGKPNGIYILYTGPIEGNPPTWYLNVTLSLTLVTSSKTVGYSLTIPVIIDGYAEYPSVSLPYGTYLSGQTVSFALTNIIGYPANLGYYTAATEVANVSINGVEHAIPYTLTPIVSVPTTYSYTVTVDLGSMTLIDYSGGFTVLPAQSLPVIFVTSYPTSALLGSKVTITFQFTYNTPVENVSASAFTHSTSTFAYTFASMVTTNAIVKFYANWLSANDGLILITQNNNYLIPFNGSAGLSFVNNSVTTLTFNIITGHYVQITSSAGGVLTISNTSPITAIGFYYGAGKLVLNWFFTSGFVLESATANQAYTILTGNSTLTQYVNGYTNASGYGTVTVTLTNTPYELIDIYWGGAQKYV